MDINVIPIYVLADGRLEIGSDVHSVLKLDTSNYPIQITSVNSRSIKVQYKSTAGPSHTELDVYGCTAVQVRLPTIEKITCSIEHNMVIVIRLCRHKNTDEVFIICESGTARRYSPYVCEAVDAEHLEVWIPSEHELQCGTPSQLLPPSESETMNLGSFSTLLKPPPFKDEV